MDRETKASSVGALRTQWGPPLDPGVPGNLARFSRTAGPVGLSGFAAILAKGEIINLCFAQPFTDTDDEINFWCDGCLARSFAARRRTIMNLNGRRPPSVRPCRLPQPAHSLTSLPSFKSAVCLSGVLALSASACVAGKLDGSFSPESKGTEGTLDYRVSTLNSSGDPISAWVLTSNDVSSLLVRPDSALGSRLSALTRATRFARQVARRPDV